MTFFTKFTKTDSAQTENLLIFFYGNRECATAFLQTY
jgi:hypothetical protein